MTTDPYRYRDYLRPQGGEVPDNASPPCGQGIEPQEAVPDIPGAPPYGHTPNGYIDYVVIMPNRERTEWTALWEGEHEVLGEIETRSRSDAIVWARAHSSVCFIFSDNANDI